MRMPLLYDTRKASNPKNQTGHEKDIELWLLLCMPAKTNATLYLKLNIFHGITEYIICFHIPE